MKYDFVALKNRFNLYFMKISVSQPVWALEPVLYFFLQILRNLAKSFCGWAILGGKIFPKKFIK